MTTINKPMGPLRDRGEGSKANLVAPTLVAVVALVIGFGIGWLSFRDTGVDVPSDVQSLVGEYNQAWMDGDGDAAVALMTDGAPFISDRWGAEGGISGDALATHINVSPVQNLELGEIESITGDLPYIVVLGGSIGDFDGIGRHPGR